ncbi:ABC multidrug transporter [Aspergillus piperis CBS 112811]|uniref:ABC multidrug transporter n=1 Tax=Aspergillus piperis CBS 112811 TaxID=1448313 RepID=A0A8G1R202_9EURO|nr:ABC multidrug transporter [Aspergillus piperis CBS 112811]RAH58571.1 ABC multidrug transporter [Aspergillus piperis CBS 112811]
MDYDVLHPWLQGGEDTIAIILGFLFLVTAGVRIAFLAQESIKVQPSLQQQCKYFFLTTTVTFHFTLLLFPFIYPATGLSAVVAICGFLTAIVLLILSMCEHIRSVAPSTLVPLYVIASLCLDMAQCQRLGYQGQQSVPYIITAMLVLNKVAVILLEALPKRGILLATYRDCSPSDTAGPYSTLLLWWINPLLWKGFFTQLGVNNLYPLEAALSSQRLGDRFEAEWRRSHHLLRAVTRVLKYHILASGLPQLLLIGVKFTQPYLIQDTTRLVMDPVESQKWPAWRLIGIYALIYTAIALLGATSKHQMNRLVVSIRGGLVSLIYNKSVDLSITAVEEKAALTLMSTDIDRITMSCADMHHAWTAVIEVAVALYLLYAQLGVGFLAPGLCFACAVVAMAACTRLYPRYQNAWVGAIQERTSITSTMLGSIRSLKLLGLSAVVFQNVTSIAAPLTTFALYLGWGQSIGKTLNVPVAFSILSLLQLLEPPLMTLVQTPPHLAGALGSFDRIDAFLRSPSRQEYRQLAPSTTTTAAFEGTNDTVVLENASFGWAEDSPVLRNLHLRIPRGSLVMVVGPTGCGKSTLLKGILGETPWSSGTVSSTSSIGFADQTPWTVNDTIKASICGQSPEDALLYHEVVDCCGLLEDVNSLPETDGTKIGSNGIALSGGQRLRLTLARAAFAQKELLVLDDVFSGVDADTEEHIFRRLFSVSGPVRRRATSIILVTHAVSRLPLADWVVVLSKDGTIAEQGTYETLTHKSTGYVAGLNVNFKRIMDNDSDARSHAEHADVAVKQPAVVEANAVGEEESKMEEAPTVTESPAPKHGDWKTITDYFAAASWSWMGLCCLWSLVYITAIKAPGLLLNAFSSPSNNSTIVSTSSFLGCLGLAAVVSLMSLTLLVWGLFLRVIPRVSNGLHQKLLHTVLLAPISFFTSTDSGTVLNRFTQDLSVIDNELPGVLIGMMLQLAIFTIGACMIVASATYLLVTIPLVMMALIGIQRFYVQTSRQLRTLRLEQQAPLYTHFQETIAGLASIRAFGWTGAFRARNAILLDNSQRPMYLLKAVQAWLGLVLNLLVAALGTVLISTIAMLRDTVHPAIVGLGLLNIMSFNENLSELVLVWSLTETSLSALARVRDFVEETESEEKDSEVNSPLTAWPQYGAVEFDNFAAAYTNSAPLVLRDIDLHIQPGEKIGVCGRTGSGKSSLLAALFHLVEYRQGTLKVDGQDLAHLPRSELRQSLNIITQEPFCVHSETARFNLDPWEATSQDDAILIGALEKCQLWSVIEAKGGLNAILKTDFFSQGQWQLFCLARAILRKSRLVVLDEVSSSVDIETDRRMQEIIRHEFDGCVQSLRSPIV